MEMESPGGAAWQCDEWCRLHVVHFGMAHLLANSGYLQYFFYGENRPRLLSIYNGTDILVEKWFLGSNRFCRPAHCPLQAVHPWQIRHFVDSAYWTFTALDVARMEAHKASVAAETLFEVKMHGRSSLYSMMLQTCSVQIRHCSVSARVDKSDDHDLGNMDAFNTDGRKTNIHEHSQLFVELKYGAAMLHLFLVRWPVVILFVVLLQPLVPLPCLEPFR